MKTQNDPDIQLLHQEPYYLPREIKTFIGRANSLGVKRKLKKLRLRGWVLKSSERSAVYSRKMEYILERPVVSKREAKALGWK